MKYIICVLICCLAAGCNLRFAPGEVQKQNAYLHSRTAQVLADKSVSEKSSAQIQSLATLNADQSRAILCYYGLPTELPKADKIEDLLSENNVKLASAAQLEASQRPSGWDIADSFFEIGLALAALAGGVYGSRAAAFLADARSKAQALKEIIQGNEIFKNQNSASAAQFKDAQKQTQSAQTRNIVAQLK